MTQLVIWNHDLVLLELLLSNYNSDYFLNIKTMYTAVAAMDKNRVIGRSVDDQIPWRFSKDFAWFKKQTLNKTVIM